MRALVFGCRLGNKREDRWMGHGIMESAAFVSQDEMQEKIKRGKAFSHVRIVYCTLR